MDISEQYSRPPANADGNIYHGSDGFNRNMAPLPPVPAPGPPWPPYPSAPPVPAGHWAQFPPPAGTPFPPPPPFDPSRPPPGYFGPTHGAPRLEFTQRPEEPRAGTWSQPSRDFQPPMGENHHFSQPPAPSYQAGFQPNRNLDNLCQNFNLDYHPTPGGFSNQLLDKSWPGDSYGGQENIRKLQDEDEKQRMQDEEWMKDFLRKKGRIALHNALSPKPSKEAIPDFREKLYNALSMVSELSLVCQTLKNNLENESAWTDSYAKALELKSSLQERLTALQDPASVSAIKKKLSQVKKKRVRIRRRKAERAEEKREEEERAAEREAAIDKRLMKEVQEMEEKKREKELKLAADAVLSEVRKKQADAKRMTDILKALEKLRKLRKEAASRKGLFPEKQYDAAFEGHLTRLRSLISKRMSVYSAEEKALRVMLEGEQEEERKRDREKRLKKEMDKLLFKKREIDAMLFGEAELPPDHPLQPFLDFYTQAERSLHALVQIRREWDQFLVPQDHPDGTSVPVSWVIPDPPGDDVWATALEK